MKKISVITSLYRCKKYLKNYFAAVDKISNKEECEFLLLHNAPSEEEILIINTEIEGKVWFRHIIIKDLEGLYVTWNKGVKLSNGIYCAIWNVDDVRFPNSLFIQSKALDENPHAMYAHGDFEKVSTYEGVASIMSIEPDTNYKPYAKIHRHLGGCFPMWRTSVHEFVGYFDEQLKLASDLDFQIRIGLGFTFTKVDAILGLYLYSASDRQSNNIKLQHVENNLIYKRYKLYSLIDPLFLFNNKGYDIDRVCSFCEQINIEQYNLNIKRDKPILLIGFVKLLAFPYYVARYLKKYI